MNQDSLSCDSFEEENIITRASPKSYQQQNQPTRSRFSILTDMNENNSLNKKAEDQSLLSRYMKDLHDQQIDNSPKVTQYQANSRQFKHEAMAKETRKGQQVRNRESNEYDWKRKNGAFCSIQNTQNTNKSNQNSEKSKSIKKQSESYGIFMYKMKIDLNKPIDYSLQNQQNIHRNYGQSRNSSKFLPKQKTSQDMLFGNALRQQHYHHSKNTRF